MHHLKIFLFGSGSLGLLSALDNIPATDIYKAIVAVATLAVHVIQLIRDKKQRNEIKKQLEQQKQNETKKDD